MRVLYLGAVERGWPRYSMVPKRALPMWSIGAHEPRCMKSAPPVSQARDCLKTSMKGISLAQSCRPETLMPSGARADWSDGAAAAWRAREAARPAAARAVLVKVRRVVVGVDCCMAHGMTARDDGHGRRGWGMCKGMLRI